VKKLNQKALFDAFKKEKIPPRPNLTLKCRQTRTLQLLAGLEVGQVSMKDTYFGTKCEGELVKVKSFFHADKGSLLGIGVLHFKNPLLS
jgi:hypothetical protein